MRARPHDAYTGRHGRLDVRIRFARDDRAVCGAGGGEKGEIASPFWTCCTNVSSSPASCEPRDQPDPATWPPVDRSPTPSIAGCSRIHMRVHTYIRVRVLCGALIIFIRIVRRRVIRTKAEMCRRSRELGRRDNDGESNVARMTRATADSYFAIMLLLHGCVHHQFCHSNYCRYAVL